MPATATEMKQSGQELVLLSASVISAAQSISYETF